MKKKLILWAATAVVLIAAVLVLVIPRPLLGEDAAVLSVCYKTEDITEKVDTDELIAILSEAKTTFSIEGNSVYWTNDPLFEVNMNTKGTSLHIVFGKNSCVYDRQRRIARTIKNGDELYEKILELIP